MMKTIKAQKMQTIKTPADLGRAIVDIVDLFQQGYDIQINIVGMQKRDAAWDFGIASTRQMLEIAEESGDQVTAIQMRSKLKDLEAERGDANEYTIAYLYEDAGITDEEWGSNVIKEIMEEEE